MQSPSESSLQGQTGLTSGHEEPSTKTRPDCSGSSLRSSMTDDSGFHSGSSLTSYSSAPPSDGAGGDDVASIPRNFSWVLDDVLCACGFPETPAQLRYLADQGVTYIVSLTAERDLSEEDVEGMEVIRLKVKDMTPPSMEQVSHFVDIMEQAEQKGKSVAVHCAAGRGRTGTVIACYLVKRFRITARQAVNMLRRLRPKSVETQQQENLVDQFESLLQQQQSRSV